MMDMMYLVHVNVLVLILLSKVSHNYHMSVL